MYSSLRKIAGFTILLGVFNLVSAVVLTLFFGAMPELSPSMRIALNAFAYTGAAAYLIIGCYLWSLYTDLANHEDSNFNDISSLRHRIDILEKRSE